MIKPCGHRVVVKVDPIVTKTESGIEIIVDETLEKAQQMRGILVAIGPQAWKAFSKDYDGDNWANVGDYVLFSKYAGKNVSDPVDKTEYKMLNDEDVIAIITEGTYEIPVNEMQKKLVRGFIDE